MKLKDFYYPPLIEIEIGASQELGLTDESLLTQLKPTGKDIEGFPLFSLQVDDDIVFAIKTKTGELLSILIASIVVDFPDNKRKTIRILRSWTPEQYRNKGYSTALYDGLPRMGFRLISDLLLSQEAVSVWKKLMTKREVKYYDTTTHQFTNKDPLTNKDVSFVLEFTGSAPSALLEDSKLFTTEDFNDCP